VFWVNPSHVLMKDIEFRVAIGVPNEDSRLRTGMRSWSVKFIGCL
jgi:hypothetical protein